MEIKRLTEGDQEQLLSMTREVVTFLNDLMIRKNGKPSSNVAINILAVTLSCVAAQVVPKEKRKEFADRIAQQILMTIEANDEESS